MKKICCLVLSIFVITSLLVGCQTNKNQVPTINTNDTEMLKEKYITPIIKSGVYGNWETAEDILPICLLEFYFYSGNLDYDKVEVENSMYSCYSYYFNQDKLENFIMKYFDVTPEYIRKADDYKKDKNAYIFGGINGGEIPTKITTAKQQDDILTINYEILDIHGETYYICETKIKLIDKENYKYIWCSMENANI